MKFDTVKSMWRVEKAKKNNKKMVEFWPLAESFGVFYVIKVIMGILFEISQ